MIPFDLWEHQWPQHIPSKYFRLQRVSGSLSLAPRLLPAFTQRTSDVRNCSLCPLEGQSEMEVPSYHIGLNFWC